MKRLLFVALLATSSTFAMAQNETEAPMKLPTPPKFQSNLVARPMAPTFSDLNCSGFVTREEMPAKNVVIGGEHSPHVSQFAGRDLVFLNGEGLSVGQQVRFIRRVSDKNRVEAFPGHYKLVKNVGDQWADLGYAHVVQVIDGTPMAYIDYSCQPIVVGDLVVPYADRPAVPFSRTPKEFKEFGVPVGSTVGMIVEAKDFDYLLGTGKKVYLNIGADKGLKAGDYLRVTRGYDWEKDTKPIDRISTKSKSSEETSDRMPAVLEKQEGKFPRRGLGEMVVLWTTPNSAVALITVSREDIHIGDQVELQGHPTEQAAQQ